MNLERLRDPGADAAASTGREIQRLYALAREAAIELEAQRSFAQAIMEAWPLGDVDGDDLQGLAIKHGLLELRLPAPTEPCCESCNCAEYCSTDEWRQGVECYRKTPRLTGMKT